MKNQRIIHIVTQMEAGGAQKAAIQVCEELIKRGFISEVWFLYKKRPTYTDRPYVRWLWEEKPKTFGEFLGLLVKLYQWLRVINPDGVITYTHYANIIGQTVAYAAGVPHRLATQRNPCWSYPPVARWIDRIIGSIGIYTSNIFVSKQVESSFQTYPASYLRRSQVVLNGLKPPIITQTRLKARKSFNFPSNRCIIVSIGRLAHQKNHALLIKTMIRLPSSQYYLVIAGDGELRGELHKLIQATQCTDRICLLGEVPPQRIGELLAAGDIFALPSRYEAFGFASVEAMMAGLPIVVSDLAVNREIIGDAGIFLPIDNVDEWERTFRFLAQNEQIRRELGERARERAALYTLEHMVDGYICNLLQHQ
ncbi:glycosyltransferase family 4 protein [Chloroflexus sp.]|uniref:glycosyltransferase family 4 protein n=1 Tax=Chloroflexus sp. TaxID=1904827 RepID=UPI002ACE1DB1|nr:glycosyltransferase family 4 protein [Chloroflexus sp.]